MMRYWDTDTTITTTTTTTTTTTITTMTTTTTTISFSSSSTCISYKTIDYRLLLLVTRMNLSSNLSCLKPVKDFPSLVLGIASHPKTASKRRIQVYG